MQVVIRKFNPLTDSGLIYSSYPKNAYYASHAPINPKDDPQLKSAWFKAFYVEVKNQLATSTIHIACMSDDPQTILGYAILTGKALEFIYVKQDFRNQGIAKLLLKNQPIETYKHVTKVGHAILNKKETKDE